MEILKYPQAVKGTFISGCMLLLFSVWIFIAAVTYNTQWLMYSLLSFLSGLVGVNVSSLIAEDKILVSDSDPVIKSSEILTQSEFVPIDWYPILKNNIMPYGKAATAQVGVSEAYFEKFLNKYFEGVIYPGYEFKINEEYSYSSDFTIILPNQLSFIVEVDEPYVGKTGSPHHCTDNNKDTNRDLFFLDGNWIVIRFSEYQVCAYPIECCYTIAKTIDRIDSSSTYAKQFKGISILPLDNQWTSRQAAAMAKNNYRRQYLAKYNIYK
jgi:very-short-patch-repair endonuclease